MFHDLIVTLSHCVYKLYIQQIQSIMQMLTVLNQVLLVALELKYHFPKVVASFP